MSMIALTNFDQRSADVLRQQKLAELLQQQASQPLESIGTFGGVPTPISPLQGLAKLLQTYAAATKQKRADREEAQIKADERKEALETVGKITATTQSDLTKAPTAIPQPDHQGLLDALKGRLGLGQPAPPPMAQGPAAPSAPALPPPVPTGPPMAPVGAPAAAVTSPPPPQGVGPPPVPAPAPKPDAQGLTPMPEPQTVAPPLQPVQKPVTQHQTTPQERQQMALEAMVSGNPYLKDVAPAMYTQATKEIATAKIGAAVAKMPFSDEQKALITQLGEMGGEDAAMKGVEAFLKPADQTEMTKNYNEAKKQGYTGSFMDFMAFAKPQVTVAGPGAQVYNTRDLTGQNPPPGGAPAAIGQQVSTAVSSAIPGVKVTSIARSPDHNSAVGGVPNSYHLEGAAVDFTPPPNMTMAQLEAHVRQTVGPGFQVLNEGSHVHVEPGPTMGVPHGQVAPVAVVPNRPLAPRGGASGQWALTAEESAALNKAVGERRIDLKGLNSRTAKIAAQALLANPGLNAVQLHAVANVTANPAFQQRAKALEALPDSLKLVEEAGSKLNFSNLSGIGNVQAWVREHTNDPSFRTYVSMRNDALQRLAYAMRGVGMSDNAVNLELQASPVAMSPRAFRAWYEGQMQLVQKQIEHQSVFQVVGSNPPPAAAPQPGGAGHVRTYNPATGRLE